MKENEGRVLNTLRKVTGIDITSIDYEENLKDQINLDSMQLVELFSALENEFQLELPLEIMKVRKYGEFMHMLNEEIEKTKNEKEEFHI